MNYKRSLGTASTALLIIIVITLVLAPAAWAASKYRLLHRFHRGATDGGYSEAGLIFDAAGNLYGTTTGGGAHGRGTVFKFTPNADGSWTESVLHPFGVAGAQEPHAGLIFDRAGNLYGTAVSGGSAGDGAAFKLSPNLDGSWAYSLIHVFQGNPAKYPDGGLVLGSAGTLYGTTSICGDGCAGVVYQITP
jgi:uncharacterized repeat protein (TIGR03803 family)